MNIIQSKKIATLSLLCVLISLGFNLSGQSTSSPVAKSGSENSPYSRYGIGLLADVPSTLLRAMGGGSAAYNNEININTTNPATYSFLKATTIDFAFETKSRSVSFENQPGINSVTGNISYLSLGIPLKKIGGLAFGFNPVSNIYYHMVDTGLLGDDSSITRYMGNGGLQQAFIGLSGTYKNVSLGINFGYTFGNFKNVVSLAPYNNTTFRVYEQFLKTGYKGTFLKAGAAYKLNLNKGYFINFGATYNGEYALKGKQDKLEKSSTYQYSSSKGVNILLNTDTIEQYEDMAGKLTMPSTLQMGIHFGKANKLDAVIDYQMSDWSNYTKYGVADSIADNNYRFSAGIGYTPDYTALQKKNGKYLNAITYHLGGYFGTDYVQLRSNQLSIVGGTLGLSFPFKRSSTNSQYGQVHTALNFGRRGTFENGLAKETYIKFTIGVSLNDIWFVKPKYE